MNRKHLLLATLWCLVLPISAAGQPAVAMSETATLRGESTQTRKRLAEAEQKVLAGKGMDAVDDLQRVLDEAGDDLITTDGKQYRSARYQAQRILCGLTGEALASYRDRIDIPARKLLEEGKKDRNPRPLWQLVDRYFVSRSAEEGSLLLGDLLFERGEFRTAELLWRRLLPDGDIVYPSARERAEVRARVILAAIFSGESVRASAELGRFRAAHPAAVGLLAGKEGPFADTLQGFLDHPPVLSAAATGRDWPTLGGSPERTGKVLGRLPRYWPSSPTWRRILTTEGGPDAVGTGRGSPRPPLGHPVIVDGRVHVSDGVRVYTVNARTGEPAPTISPLLAYGIPPSRDAAPPGGGSLTAADGRLYARLALPVPRAVTALPGMAEPTESVIACITKTSTGLKTLWRARPPSTDAKLPAYWDGSPLVAGGRMWVGLCKFEGGRVTESVAGFDPADPGEAPSRPAWITELCDSPLQPGIPPRPRTEVLTLAGRNVVSCPATGVVVALDASTGRRAWAFRYPSARRGIDTELACLPAPAVVANGRVFVCPADADRVYALDAETGALLWESGRVEGATVHGVGGNRVIVSGSGALPGIRALDAASGMDRPGGWLQQASHAPRPYGRGLVGDDLIVWPGRDGLFFLSPMDGLPLGGRSPAVRVSGNVAYAAGVLVVVSATEVMGFVAEPQANPDLPSTPNSERRQFEIAIDKAEELLASGDRAGARSQLIATAKSSLPTRWRAWAIARLVLLEPVAASPKSLPGDVRELIDPDLAREWVLSPGGEPVSLGRLVAQVSEVSAAGEGLRISPTADDRRDVASATCATATIASSVTLPSGVVPLRPISGSTSPARHVFAASADRLVAVRLAGREVVARPVPDSLTHASNTADGFVAAGPGVVAVYRGEQLAWVFRVPDTDPLPAGLGRVPVRTDEPVVVPQLSGFVLGGGWLFARLGETHLIAFDLPGARVAWVLGTHSRARYEWATLPGLPRFEQVFLFTGNRLIVQLSDGRRWTVRAETGRIGPAGSGFESATARAPWASPPAEIDPDRVVIADGPGTVTCVSPASGRIQWSYACGRELSLTGEPPQVRVMDRSVLVAVRRNHGVEVDRLNLATGRSVWSGGPVFLDTDRIDLASICEDRVHVYLPTHIRIMAVSLEDGKRVWETVVPRTDGWVVRRGGDAVIAFPRTPVPEERMDDLRRRLFRSLLDRPALLPTFTCQLYHGWVDRRLPVLFLKPKSGRRVNDLTIPAFGPTALSLIDQESLVLAVGGRVVWIK